MLRLITIWCLIHLSVGNTIRGRVLLDGDINRNDPIPANSRLLIRAEQISEADTSGAISEEIEISTLDAFPVDYEIQTPSASSYRLVAQVKRGPVFLYVGEKTTLATSDSNHSITVDIPVRVVRGRVPLPPSLIDSKPLSWPKLVGSVGTYAVQYIKESTGLTKVMIVPDGSAVTMDYRADRVRVFVNKDGIVIRTPVAG